MISRRLQVIFFIFTAFIASHQLYAGVYCGSDATVASKIYQKTSSDLWPSFDLSDVVLSHLGVNLTPLKAVCGFAYGQANFGGACYRHDGCYDGLVSPGFTRDQCDEQVHNEWKQACYNQYSHSWWDETKNKCQNYCSDTADAMYIVLNANSVAAWNKAKDTRDKNTRSPDYLAKLSVSGVIIPMILNE